MQNKVQKIHHSHKITLHMMYLSIRTLHSAKLECHCAQGSCIVNISIFAG